MLTKKYIYLDVSAAKYIIEKKVKTIGVDYLSVEDSESKDFQVHKLLLSNEIGIIEGLYLKDVNAGIYLLSALPLKIEDVDGVPTRAVLVEFM